MKTNVNAEGRPRRLPQSRSRCVIGSSLVGRWRAAAYGFCPILGSVAFCNCEAFSLKNFLWNVEMRCCRTSSL
jgi:hypothetical protein